MAAAYTEQSRQKEKLEEALQNVRKGMPTLVLTASSKREIQVK